LLRLIFNGLLAAIVLQSCTGPAGEDEGRTVFRYNEASGVHSLDPAFAKDLAHIWPCSQIFNGLLQLDDSLSLQPCIARTWEADPTGLVYRFHLRNDVYFHDHPLFEYGKGRRVTARDFIYSFSRILDPSVASPGAWVFSRVDTANGKPAFEAPDDSTLIIRLREPFPAFPGILAMVYCSVVPWETVEKPGADFRRQPAGTGPFRTAYWKEGVKLVLLKNDNYFETDGSEKLPYLDAVAITFLADKQAAFLEFIKGKIDFISGLDVSYKDELIDREGRLREEWEGRFTMTSEPFLNTEYLSFLVDTTKAALKESPLRHREIRMAINHAFDRRRMIRYLRNNIGTPGYYGIIPPGLPAFDSTLSFYRYDPEKARQLILQAGYRTPDEVPAFKLHTTAEYTDLFKFIQHELAIIGLRMEIEVNPAAALMEMKSNSKIAFFRASWIADYPDEENYLSLFYSQNFSPAGPNYSHFSNPVFDKLYEKSQECLNDEERLNIYRELNRMIMDEAPVVILYYDQVLRFTSLQVTGLGSNPLNFLSLKRVKKL
jgi:peptide/nickel transport system substrate-binding protein